MDRPYRLALVCGIAPQAVGVAILFLWFLTRWEWLMGAGLATIYAGVFSVLIGAIALAMWTFDRSGSRSSPGQRRIALPLAASILATNFPVAAAAAFGALTIMTAYVVTIHNDSAAPLRDVRVYGGCCKEQLIHEMAPGSTIKRFVWFNCDGTLEFEATINGKRKAAQVEGYVTGNQGGAAEITVDPNGAIDVRVP